MLEYEVNRYAFYTSENKHCGQKILLKFKIINCGWGQKSLK